MQRISGSELEEILPFFKAAAAVAKESTCHRAKCGAVILKDHKIIGKGYNGPALYDEANRKCDHIYNLSIKPKYDKTCCVHAEWRAILDACKNSADKIGDSDLYFIRVDEKDNFTNAGEPYCTTCSRLALESGIGKFILWNADGANIYNTAEYNNKSYQFFKAI